MIDITILGTNALLPIPERALTAVALSCNGRKILFDCGEGTQSAARKAGVSLMKTDVIALTHYHGDHIFGIPGLLQSMNVMGRKDPLYITGPKGLEEAMQPIRQLAGDTEYPIELIEGDGNDLELSGINATWPKGCVLRMFDTAHGVSSCGYRFETRRLGKFLPDRAKAKGIPVSLWTRLQNGETVEYGNVRCRPEDVMSEPREGLTFAFTGDTTYDAAIAKACAGADLLISEATYGEDGQEELAKEHGHMTFRQAAQLAKEADVKELRLVHFSQMIKEPKDYLCNAKDVFENAECGFDGMKITLRFAD